ncbi:MAG: T9SS type A sorting domain-containing protein [Bacteroidetes bacterium]|nr:T9SS type A sorting domain-containing protein [Bacteroidota bacterium]
MRNSLLTALIVLASAGASIGQEAHPTKGKMGLIKVVNFSKEAPDYDPSVQNIDPIHAPGGEEDEFSKVEVDSIRAHSTKRKGFQQMKTAAPAPKLQYSFDGNVSAGTPNDNDMCIGNNGYIISVVNSTLFVYDSTGKIKKTGSLSFFAKELGKLDRSYDPRVLYDPNNDRFIAVFLNGTLSTDNTPVVAFSQTNDPTGNWNFYQLPGNPLNDTSWSDYPIISLSNHDLFLTLNLLHDNMSWQEGFRQSIIWQMDLSTAYAGDSVDNILWTNINFEGKPVWSICPAQGGMHPEGPKSYFLSVHPGSLNNDSLFIHTITNSVESGKATLNTRFVRMNKSYGLPPSAPQGGGQYLQTNDARVLSAMHQNGLLHFAGNTRDFQNDAAGIYYGVIDPDAGTTANVTILSYDTLDLGYPDIAYAGTGNPDDQTVIITVSHVSPTTFPGTSVILMNYSGQFSDLTRVKEGTGIINEMTDTLERWGDYSGIQRKYNEDRSFWLAGTYGDNINRTIIAKVLNTDPALHVPSAQPNQLQLYPNPSTSYFELRFEVEEEAQLTFKVIDMQGKEVCILLRDEVHEGLNRFRFSTEPLPAGSYVLLIQSNEGLVHSERFVVNR